MTIEEQAKTVNVVTEVKTVVTTTCATCEKQVDSVQDGKCPVCETQLKQDVEVTVLSLPTFAMTY